MSEYQYYEFQAIDRPLIKKEQDEIRRLSSRVQLTPNQAIFLYNFGDFRGNSEKVLTQYFDMMFYIANWGTWQLMFRLPKAIVDLRGCLRSELSQASQHQTNVSNVDKRL